jgi:hypothetical protein
VLSQRLGRQAGIRQDARRAATLDSRRRHEQVLGAGPAVAELARLLLRGCDDLARDPGEAEERAAATATPPRELGGDVGADDLVHALVREAELGRDLSQRAACHLQPPDRVVVVRLRALRVVLQLEQPAAERARLLEDLFV